LARLTVVDHPLVAHRLSLLRDRTTPPELFRNVVHGLGLLLGYEALRDLPTAKRRIDTPVAPTEAAFLSGSMPVLVPILRAGNGLLAGMLELLPLAPVGHLGIYRDAATLAACEYYCKLPTDVGQRLLIVLDPMLATGNSAIAAVHRLKEHGARSIRLLCLLAAPEGVAALAAAHADVAVIAAAVDERLNEHGYIVPGLGDAGDRLYGTA
jgi:uracil phosphoribosyltransferase